MAGIVPRIFVIVLATYFLGNMNGAVIISSLLDQDDVRTHGSGNAGMTNYLRSYGLQKTGLVIIIDLGKAMLAAYLGGLLMEQYGFFTEGALLGGVFVSLGHDFPLALGFRGGKGILCGLGIALVADWRVALLIIAVFAVLVMASSYVSLGSVFAAVTYGVSFTLLHLTNPAIIVMGWIIALSALFMHRGNIQRLLSGTERKLSFHTKSEE